MHIYSNRHLLFTRNSKNNFHTAAALITLKVNLKWLSTRRKLKPLFSHQMKIFYESELYFINKNQHKTTSLNENIKPNFQEVLFK